MKRVRSYLKITLFFKQYLKMQGYDTYMWKLFYVGKKERKKPKKGKTKEVINHLKQLQLVIILPVHFEIFISL